VNATDAGIVTYFDFGERQNASTKARRELRYASATSEVRDELHKTEGLATAKPCLYRQSIGIVTDYDAIQELLQRRQRFARSLRGGSGTGRVVMNGPRLVAAEAADSGEILGDWSPGDEISITARRAAANRGSDRRSNSSKSENKSAFHVWRRGYDFVEQNGLIASRRPSRRATQRGEVRGKTIAIGRTIGHGGGGYGAHGDGGGCFIGSDARIQQAGNRDGRDDENDRDDDQQFDQGETALSGSPEFLCPICFLGEHDRNNFLWKRATQLQAGPSNCVS